MKGGIHIGPGIYHFIRRHPVQIRKLLSRHSNRLEIMQSDAAIVLQKNVFFSNVPGGDRSCLITNPAMPATIVRMREVMIPSSLLSPVSSLPSAVCLC
jgi:hypothetical protein